MLYSLVQLVLRLPQSIPLSRRPPAVGSGYMSPRNPLHGVLLGVLQGLQEYIVINVRMYIRVSSMYRVECRYGSSVTPRLAATDSTCVESHSNA